MNKFVLNSFLIAAIFMAQLPSNLACFSKPTTTTTTTTPKPPPRTYDSPLEKEVNEYFQNCFPTYAWEMHHEYYAVGCCKEINRKYGRYSGPRAQMDKIPYPAELVPECVEYGAGRYYNSKSEFIHHRDYPNS